MILNIHPANGGTSSTLDNAKTQAESSLSGLSTYLSSSISMENVSEIESKLATTESDINSYVGFGGKTSDLTNYSNYTTLKANLDAFKTEKETLKTNTNKAITDLDAYMTEEELTSESTLTDEQYEYLVLFYDEAKAAVNSYTGSYGLASDLVSTANLKVADNLIKAYENANLTYIEKTYVYDFEENSANYSNAWSTSYTTRVLTSGMFDGEAPYVYMDFDSANFSAPSGGVSMPVTKAGSLIVTAPDSTFNSFSVDLKQWGTNAKTVKLYYYNGSSWVACGSGSTFTSGAMTVKATSIPEGVTKIKVDCTTTTTNQVRIKAISCGLKTKQKDVIKSDYYASINDTYTGETLWSALETLTSTTHKYVTSYYDVGHLTYLTDVDFDNPGNIICLYSRASVAGTWDGGSTWNREHLWCQSKAWYGDVSKINGAGTDLHHMRPEIPNVNSSRNNHVYGEITNRNSYAKSYTLNGTTYQYGYLNTTTDVFEPLDDVKGDVARILMYLLVRYKTIIQTGDSKQSSYPITANVYTSAGTNEAVYDMLVRWSNADPVDELELYRNEAVYALQGNRNPFIDNPNYANLIWGK